MNIDLNQWNVEGGFEDKSRLRTYRISHFVDILQSFRKKWRKCENRTKWPLHTFRVSHSFLFRSRHKKSTKKIKNVLDNSFDVSYKNCHSLRNGVKHKMQKPVLRTMWNAAKILYALVAFWEWWVSKTTVSTKVDR